ncbi:MAG TPA: hypothetical protein VFG10_16455 [Saprospiraceae bacterium]|nr:hypothetical protein [Saprospiraceae bacterium]
MFLRKSGFFTLLSFALVQLTDTIHAQSITLNTQTEVNAFDPAITVINGSLTIFGGFGSDSITNLSPLSGLVSVTGDLTIDYAEIVDLKGLGALRNVGDDFYLGNNTHLKSIDDLTSLTTVGGELIIRVEDSLTSLSGLESLNTIGDKLTIEHNRGLQSISGFNNLTHVGGDIIILNNSFLAEINCFNTIDTIHGDLLMENNTILSTITGFQKLTEVKGDLTLSKTKLSTLDFLYTIEHIGGQLTLELNNDLVAIPDLPNLKHVGDLHIRLNNLLTDIAGFNGLVSVDYALNVGANNITQISGFRNLLSVGNIIGISGNDLLTDIYGFSSLESANHITINVNPSLVNFEGFAQLKSVKGLLHLNSNNAMTNVDAFLGLTDVNFLTISSCDYLTNLDGFSNMTSLASFSVSLCDRLERIYLPKIRTVQKNLDVTLNPSLKTLELPELDSIKSNIQISGNALEDLNGLSNLKYAGDNLNITKNEMLMHLNGLKNLRYVGGELEISRNTNLSDCCGISQLLLSPGAIGTITTIYQNNTGCDNKNEVISNASCVHVINDVNGNCIWDGDEKRLPGRFAILMPGNIILTSSASGQFDLSHLLAGQYSLQIDTSGPWTTTCSIERTFEVLQDGEIPVFDPFALQVKDPCAVPTVSIQMPFVRRCFTNQRIIIQACNDVLATGALEDAFVLLTLDSLLTFQNSSLPATLIGPNIYSFSIGDLSPEECITINVQVQVSCDAVIGQSLCVQAELTPADTCIFEDQHRPLITNSACGAPYLGSNIAVSGYCDTDSVHFRIENLTDIPTECHVPLRLFRDETFLWKDSILLEGHGVNIISFLADGRTIRLEADQHPDYPWLSRPNSTIERCGDLSNWSPGLRNAFYQDDLSPVIDITCGVVTGSYDPNDKSASPRGLGAQHKILPNEPLDYIIRFQNTGNDTAFTVVVRDTLDGDLDIFSVKPGAASHPYTFTMHGPRVLEWEFQNILLPDSSTNEEASHGFLSFQVRQHDLLPEGTVISNQAGIYFDFNEPVLTNTVTHVINDLDDIISSVIPDQFMSEKNGRIVPNPSGGSFDIVFDEVKSDIRIEMYNSTGLLMNKGQYRDTNIIHSTFTNSPGFYFIHVLIPGERSFVLKAVVN